MDRKIEGHKPLVLDPVYTTNTMNLKLNFITKARIQNGGILFCCYQYC